MFRNPQKNSFSRVRRNGRYAFTLVEMIVVLVVLAIAASVIVPYAVGTTSFQASAAARLVMSDLEYAQSQATTTLSDVSVTFNVSGDSYTVSNASGTLIHPISKKAYVVDFDTMSGFENVSVTAVDFGGATDVTFNNLGAPDSGGAITVVSGSHTYTVTVAPVSGRVTVAGE